MVLLPHLPVSFAAADAPVCEELRDGVLRAGEQCYSTCAGECPARVLEQGLFFKFDNPDLNLHGCKSHFECVGPGDRTLCHAYRIADELGFARQNAEEDAMPFDLSIFLPAPAAARARTSRC